MLSNLFFFRTLQPIFFQNTLEFAEFAEFAVGVSNLKAVAQIHGQSVHGLAVDSTDGAVLIEPHRRASVPG